MPLTSLLSRIFWRFVTLHESSPVRQQFLKHYELCFIKHILNDFFSLHHFYCILYYSVTHVRWDINLQNIQSLVLLLIFYVHRLVVQGSGSAKKKTIYAWETSIAKNLVQAYTTWKEKIMNTVNDEYSRYQLGNQESGHFENIEFHKVLLLEYHMPNRGKYCKSLLCLNSMRYMFIYLSHWSICPMNESYNPNINVNTILKQISFSNIVRCSEHRHVTVLYSYIANTESSLSHFLFFCWRSNTALRLAGYQDEHWMTLLISISYPVRWKQNIAI